MNGLKMENDCQLVPVMEYDDEDYGPYYSDTEFYCETCGEYVDGRCDE